MMKAGLILACITLFSLQTYAEVYRWTDADGKVHFTDQPPPGKVGDKPMKIQTQGGVQEVSKKAIDDSAKKSQAGCRCRGPPETQ